jgi:predicted RNase H-like nuclease
MSTLLVGFDSAWTGKHDGAIIGALRGDDKTLIALGEPHGVDFDLAAQLVEKWRYEYQPASTIVLIDQPIIVPNETGQRCVDRMISSPIARRGSAVQPANRGRDKMFGDRAPIWKFLERFGGPADPWGPAGPVRVFETYPALALVALGWTLDRHLVRRLPKYNPHRRGTFSLSDWEFVCKHIENAFRVRGLHNLADWTDRQAKNISPRKQDQDRIDACLCLLVGLCIVEVGKALVVGNYSMGYIMVPVPREGELMEELKQRCSILNWRAEDFIHVCSCDS